MTLVRPYDDPLVMAGQGTAAIELLDDVPAARRARRPRRRRRAPVGLRAGGEGIRSGIRVVGVEPEAGDDARRSLAAGERVQIDTPRTIADGLGAPEPGELTFAVMRALVDEIVTVTDDEILDAMAFLFDRLKLVTEPSGAVGIAALLKGRVSAPGASVGVVISGGNVGVSRFAALLGGR